MVEHPGEYRWASYGFNAHGEGCGINLKEHPSYKALIGIGDDPRKKYRELFDSALGVEMMYEIRQSLNSCLVLGNERFKDQIEAQLERKVRHGKVGRPSKKSRLSAMR